MGLKQSQGWRSLNLPPSQQVAPRSRDKRLGTGSSFYLGVDAALDAIATRDGGTSTPKIDYAMVEVECPCCKRPVQAPSLEIIVDHYRVTPLEARILGAVWRGKGYPVQTRRIFDAMYADDANGGPTPSRMYSAFKVALCHLRKRLEGSGVSIENVGYGRGYRLVIREKERTGHEVAT